MSSQPSETPEDQEPNPPPKGRRPFERWRKIMLAASVVLLATAVAKAILKEDMPDFLYALGYALGFVGLAWGYGVFWRTR